MSKQILSGFLAVAIGLFMFGCQNSNDQVRDDARAQIESMKQVAQASLQSKMEAEEDLPQTTMEFDARTFDFGTITEGEMVSHTFTFTNTGENPLILRSARGSCGCTVPQWPREPIAPGESSTVTVEFNSKNKVGKRNQTVTLTANTQPTQTIINLTGEVVKNQAGPLVNQ